MIVSLIIEKEACMTTKVECDTCGQIIYQLERHEAITILSARLLLHLQATGHEGVSVYPDHGDEGIVLDIKYWDTANGRTVSVLRES